VQAVMVMANKTIIIQVFLFILSSPFILIV
jgi:hypothetical protein